MKNKKPIKCVTLIYALKKTLIRRNEHTFAVATTVYALNRNIIGHNNAC